MNSYECGTAELVEVEKRVIISSHGRLMPPWDQILQKKKSSPSLQQHSCKSQNTNCNENVKDIHEWKAKEQNLVQICQNLLVRKQCNPDIFSYIFLKKPINQAVNVCTNEFESNMFLLTIKYLSQREVALKWLTTFQGIKECVKGRPPQNVCACDPSGRTAFQPFRNFFFLPQLPILLFSWYFNNPRLINNSGCASAFFYDANNPRLVTLLLLDVLAVGGRLLPRQANQQASGGFRGVALQQLEHVAARLGHCCHFGDHGQVVDNKGHLVLLVPRQILRVAQQTESCHVRRTVGVVLVHQTSSWKKKFDCQLKWTHLSWI